MFKSGARGSISLTGPSRTARDSSHRMSALGLIDSTSSGIASTSSPRAVLRILLGGYLAIEPSRVNFAYGTHGRPSLADTWHDAPLKFNLAHSHGFAVYAFTRDRAIGVDVEYIRPPENMEQLAALVFSPRELTAFEAVPREAQEQAFFNGWTRKEALVKATGDGLTMPLKGAEISLTPGEPAALLAYRGRAAAAARWTVLELTTAPGYVGAVATSGTIGGLRVGSGTTISPSNWQALRLLPRGICYSVLGKQF